VKTTLFALTICFAGALSLPAADAPLPHKAPELAFKIPGQGDKLLSQYRGKVVALELIFTTCPHCQHASELMTKLQREYGPRGFQSLDVAFNDNADLKVDDFVRDFHVGFPVGWTDRDSVLGFLGLSVVDRFVVPQLQLIDRKGIVHYATPPNGVGAEAANYENAMKEETIRQRIEELLAIGASSSSHKPVASAKAALAVKN
jgi:cytochrome oxidase Cu insertion factor (SCO1/SenC/PrrC family)